MEQQSNNDRPRATLPDWIAWQTTAPVELDCGRFHAAGAAMPQVRSPQRLAAAGDWQAQLACVQEGIAGALAQILQGMQPTPAQMAEHREEIASATLAAANARLAAVGVSLLDLTIDELASWP